MSVTEIISCDGDGEPKAFSLMSSRRNRTNLKCTSARTNKVIILLILSLLHLVVLPVLHTSTFASLRLAELSKAEQAFTYYETDIATISEQSNWTSNNQAFFSKQIMEFKVSNETRKEMPSEMQKLKEVNMTLQMELQTNAQTNETNITSAPVDHLQKQQPHFIIDSSPNNTFTLETSHNEMVEVNKTLQMGSHTSAPSNETNATSVSIHGSQEQQPHTIADSSPNNTDALTTSHNELMAVNMTLQMGSQMSALNHEPKDQPLNATQIVALLNSGDILWNQTSHVFPKPAIDDYDIVSIHSQNAWLKLRNLLLDEKNEKIMVVNGGSSSTGAGRVEPHDRYHYLFANAFRNVTVEDRSHGSRNTLHSYQVMHSFLPEHTDIILWEFSINDSTYHQTHNHSIKIVEARNQLILYLDQIARVTRQRQLANPPLVILVYLWGENVYRHPFSNNFAYEAHQGIAEAYDFVVGHVNAMKYLDSFLWEPNVTQTYFLADWTHPNSLTHHLIHDLMYDLVMNEQRKERPRLGVETQTRPSFVWACGEETHQKRLMQNLLVNHYPIASFTQEYPKNEVMLSGMIHPQFAGVQIQNLGKSDPLRIDRQFAATIPCCNATSKMDFDHVSMHGTLHGMTVNVNPNASGLEVYFDNENVTDQLINCRNQTEWECFTADWYHVFYYWVVLETPRNVSKVTLCSNLPNCGVNEPDALSILSLTVYGDDKNIV